MSLAVIWGLTTLQKVSYLQNCSQCGIPRKVMIVLREGAKKGTREFYVYCAHKMLDLRPKHGISKQVQLSKIASRLTWSRVYYKIFL